MRFARVAPRRAAVGVGVRTVGLLLGMLCAACGDSLERDELTEALAQLRSDAPASRYEAVVRLGVLPRSEARRDALARAVRDLDAKVRLMAGIVVVGDEPGEHASWLPTPAPTRPSAESVPSLPLRTPNPVRSADLSPVDQLVALDPWFAGTLGPGARSAAHDGDERVRELGTRALRYVDTGTRGR